MPPKKGGAKGKGKKGKKGSGQTEDERFQDYLNEMFFISPQAREKMREDLKKQIKEVFQVYQGSNRESLAEIHEFGSLVRALGLNPTVQQLKVMRPMVQDETGTYMMYAKVEPLMIQLLETHELKYPVQASDGTTVTASQLIYKDPENVIVQAFDVLWAHCGKKIDPDRSKYIDAEPLRELLTRPGNPEAFNDQEATEFLNTAADPDSGFIKEEHFTTFCIE
jgi:Ca2+-binding EF-hand superfamily protein